MDGYQKKVNKKSNRAKMHILLLFFLILLLFGLYFLFVPSIKVPSPVSDTDYFSATQLEELKFAAAYHRAHRIIGLARFLSTLFLIVLFIVGFGKTLEEWVFNPSCPVRSALLFFLFFYIAYFIVSLPFAYASGVLVERTFGFLKMSTSQWFILHIKSEAIYLVLGALTVTILFFFIRRFEDFWWLPATGILTAISVFIAFISPLVIEPLFAKFTPLLDEKLKDDLIKVAEKAGFKVKDILISDESKRTTHTNAYFSGVGTTRRIVLYDTLLTDFTPDEVRLIVAHEAGHSKHHHIGKGLLLNALGVAVFLCFFALLLSSYCSSGEFKFAYQPRVVALFALWVLAVSFLSTPLTNFVSRKMEIQADKESLLLTNDVEAFISSEVKLAVNNLSELHPHPLVYLFYYTHPTTLERIALAEQHRKKQD